MTSRKIAKILTRESIVETKLRYNFDKKLRKFPQQKVDVINFFWKIMSTFPETKIAKFETFMPFFYNIKNFESEKFL